MTKKQAYKKAAELIKVNEISEDLFCCSVLKKVGLKEKEFHEIFKPQDMTRILPYFSYDNVKREFKETSETQLTRQLALLFMAEMEK